MCGRIAQTETPEELAELLGVDLSLKEVQHLTPSFNVPPSRTLPSLIAANERQVQWSSLEWGMLPSWASFRRPVINARCETVHEKAMFKHALQSRRCVIPAAAYFEWKVGSQGKQPYCIRRANGEPLLLAGLYTSGQCVIITRTAREDIAHIHDRMPVAIERSYIEPWLLEPKAASATFSVADQIDFDFYPVTKRIGSPRFDDPQCLEPLEAIRG